MDLDEFFHRVLPPTGTYFVATQGQSKGFSQVAANDMAELEALSMQGIQSDKATYFATGSFRDNSSRQAKNLAEKKALYLDMDCGPGKDFDSQKTAVTELFKFCTSAGIPRPNLLVNSGNGVHAYWTFNHSIPHTDWAIMAIALNTLCTEYNFPADHVVTADGARILRVPGSVNKKDPANPKKCTVVGKVGEDFAVESLTTALNKHAEPPATIPPVLPEVDADDLSNAALGQHQWYAKYIFKACPTLKYIKQSGGEDCPEPLWMQTLNLLAYCEDGASFIHPVSNQHPTYDSRMTERKFNARIKAKNEEKSGPTLCKTFAQYPQTKCASCPHNGVIKSPITLGKEPPPEPTELPYPYKQDLNGIYLMVDDQRVRVCSYRIENFEVRADPDTNEIVQVVDFKIGNSPRVYQFIGTREALNNLKVSMPNRGIILQDKELIGVRQVMTAWAQQLQAAKQVKTLSGQFGWAGDKFTAAGKQFTTAGEVYAPIADSALQLQYMPKGDLTIWKRAAAACMDGGHPELQVMLASAFAAPLIQLSSVNGAILSIISTHSGTGKSTAMKVAQSVWGHPIQGINSLNDTANSVSKRMSTLNSLPLYWDELRQRGDIKDFLSLVFRASQGRDKTRLNKSSEQMNAGMWRTLITAASNEPLKDYVDSQINTTDAGMLRIFELVMNNRKPRAFDPVASALFNKLDSNYGIAGEVYARFLVANKEVLHDKVIQLEGSFAAKLGASQNERFWISTMATLMLGATLAKKLDLIQFDLPLLHETLIKTAEEMRRAASDSVIMDDEEHPGAGSRRLVDQFILEMADFTYITEHFVDYAGEVGQFVKLPTRSPVRVYIGQEEMRVRLDKAAFRKWLSDNGHGHRSLTIIRELVDHYKAEQGRRAISPKYGAGQEHDLRTYVIELSL